MRDHEGQTLTDSVNDELKSHFLNKALVISMSY